MASWDGNKAGWLGCSYSRKVLWFGWAGGDTACCGFQVSLGFGICAINCSLCSVTMHIWHFYWLFSSGMSCQDSPGWENKLPISWQSFCGQQRSFSLLHTCTASDLQTSLPGDFTLLWTKTTQLIHSSLEITLLAWVSALGSQLVTNICYLETERCLPRFLFFLLPFA